MSDDESSPPDVAPGTHESRFDGMASLHASVAGRLGPAPPLSPGLTPPSPGWKEKAREASGIINLCTPPEPEATPEPETRPPSPDSKPEGGSATTFSLEELLGGDRSGVSFAAQSPQSPMVFHSPATGRVVTGLLDLDGCSASPLGGSVLFGAAADDLPVACHAASSASRPVPSRAEASRPVPSPAEAPPKKKRKKKRKRRKDAAKERKEDVGPRDPSTTEDDFDPQKLRAIRNGLRYLVEKGGEGTARQAWIKFAKPEGGDRNLFGYTKMLDYEAQFLSEHGTKPTPAQVAAVEAWWPFRGRGHSK